MRAKLKLTWVMMSQVLCLWTQSVGDGVGRHHENQQATHENEREKNSI
jgi:hypothetical protein